MQDFAYVAPSTLGDAIKLMAEKGDQAKVISGGTDILVQLRADRFRIELLVDVKGIPELMEISFSKKDGLTLGAAVPCYKVYENKEIAKAYPGLYDSASLIGGIQIQSRASIGGNLCNAAPSGDAIPVLIAYQAVANIQGPKGKRSVPVEQFCTGPGKNTMEPGEILVSLTFPAPQAGTGASYLRFIPRNEMDIAVAGAGVSVALANGAITSARIALASVAPTPVLATEAMQYLAGKAPTDEHIEHAAELAKKAAKPITDMRGTIEQRIHLTGVLTKRALKIAISRAKEA